MEKLISIIVPVYNAAPYLECCAQSALAQTYRNIELILVDDGSQDNSGELCEKICAKDQRVRFLRQSHKGVSAARNGAMRAAKGEYLFFLDSDDAIHPGLLAALYDLAERSGAWIAAAGYCHMGTEDLNGPLREASVRESAEKEIYLDNQTALEWFIQKKSAAEVLRAIGGKLIRWNQPRPIAFDEEFGYGEDTKFLYQLFADGADAAILRRDWYYYRLHPDNASKNRSAAACQSIYQCEKYISHQEWKSGRTANAVREELVVIDRILEWYRLSRKTCDKEFSAYLKKMANAERRFELFARLKLIKRLKFFLAFHCYPLYWAVYNMAKGLKNGRYRDD